MDYICVCVSFFTALVGFSSRSPGEWPDGWPCLAKSRAALGHRALAPPTWLRLHSSPDKTGPMSGPDDVCLRSKERMQEKEEEARTTSQCQECRVWVLYGSVVLAFLFCSLFSSTKILIHTRLILHEMSICFHYEMVWAQVILHKH